MTVIVVAAAIVREDRVLAARRSRPPRLAGGWEFPGGKVEMGEDEATALARECREELGVDVRVGARLGEVVQGDLRLVLFAATVLAGEPAPGEAHDELRWLLAEDLDAVRWLPIDRELVGVVVRYLKVGIQEGGM